MMRGSLRLGKIAGIAIDIHFSWLIIFILLTTTLALDWFPSVAPRQTLFAYWIAGGIASLVLFASVLAHELAHSLVARSRGMPVKSITLFIFGGVSNLEREPERPGVEFVMAFVGPLTSLLIGGIFTILTFAIRDTNPLVTAVSAYIAITNVALGVFNLIPGFPLDGGRVLRSILWKTSGSLTRATRWAATAGQLIAYLFILVGIWLFFTTSALNGLWFGFIGWFLLQAARSEEQQLELEQAVSGVRVADVMLPPPPSCTMDCTLHELSDNYVLRSGLRTIPITSDGAFAGLVTLKDALRVPREQWDRVPVSRIMIPRDRVVSVRAEEPLAEALKVLMAAEVSQVPVIEDDRLQGMLNVEYVLRWLQVRRTVYPERGSLPKAS